VVVKLTRQSALSSAVQFLFTPQALPKSERE
jgi:hypothetical protein